VAGFRLSLTFLFCLFSAINFINIMKAIRNAEYRKKMYISDTDERKRVIEEKTSAAYRNLSLPMLGVATVVAGSFNHTVFFCLVAVLLVQALILMGCKLYYQKKY